VSPRSAYDFHRLVRLEMASADKAAVDYFEEEYAFFRSAAESAEAKVTLAWERGPVFGGVAPGHRRHAHKRLARWSYRILLGPDHVELQAAGNRTAIPMVHHMMVHPALRYLVSGRGALLLHASSVALDGRSLILTGSGGVGKTTTASLLLAYGDPRWRPHADDYVFLRPDGTSLAYPTRSHLYQNLLTWVPALAGRLTRSERLRLRAQWWLRRGLGVKWPVRVGAERLWPGRPITPQAEVAAIVLLRRGGGGEPRLAPLPPGAFPVDELIEVNFQEARHFLDLVRAAGVGAGVGENGDGWLDTWRALETKTLRTLADRIPGYSLEIPSRSSHIRSTGQRLASALETLVRRGAG
jgi:hypothetical protein